MSYRHGLTLGVFDNGCEKQLKTTMVAAKVVSVDAASISYIRTEEISSVTEQKGH